MDMQSIREIAKSHGLKTSRMSKINLVRAIQRKEGNFDCFAKAVNRYCDQTECRWRESCLDLAAVQLSA